MVYILAIQSKFYSGQRDLIPIVFDPSPPPPTPPFWHPYPLQILLISRENSSFIATFNLVKKAAPILPMLF